ncbi:hypothetical protein E1283_03535 [Streptomyces hainanensis]|uniref:Uncharacterized protein n=2 Tax=Streptomyces hainanensis TaxID=402648 RepID=A0A4R4TMA9_9ACTN|nr:hypothetical protein E1283_03535 [Streptomyces hainanensis]
MLAKRKSLRDVARERDRDVRAEYLRSLINARQLVVNRVYFYNNHAISRDLLQDGAERDAHRRLLADGTLVPFLVGEHEPTDRPQQVDVVEDAFVAWQETVAGMAASERMTCLRLSWNDERNSRNTRSALVDPFAARVQGLTAKDIPLLADQLGVPARDTGAFAEHIGRIVEWSNARRVRGEAVNRGLLYEEFVTVPGSPVADGRYDRSRPFSGETKQLLDLVYNVNLADALGMYPLTPSGSLRRLVLQEWRDVRVTASGETIRDPEQLAGFLRRLAFATVQDRLTPASLDELTLQDVWRLRQSGAWHAYIAAFTRLTADPAHFEDHIREVFSHYATLNSEIIRLAAERPQAGSSRWSPVVEVVITIGGATFSAVSGNEIWALIGGIGSVTADQLGGSVQLMLRNRTTGRREQKFARELATVQLDGLAEWRRLHELVRAIPGYEERPAVGAATSSTTIQETYDVPEY